MATIIPISAFKDNYIWMLSHPVWVVDPGDAKPVIEVLEKQKLTLKGILLTHHHADHSGGISELLDYAKNLIVYGSHSSPIQTITHRVKQNDEIVCADISFKVIEIPGHTLDHTAYYGNEALFCGDTLFSAGCGRIFEGTPTQMYDSLQKLYSLPDQTKIYCGHEYTLVNLNFAKLVEPNNQDILNKIQTISSTCTLPSLLSVEKKINPFLRCKEQTVIQAVEKYCGKSLNNEVEVFAELRKWKNEAK